MSTSPVPPVPQVPLGGSGLDVSRLALGSWRTYERISREQGIAVMRAAREVGVTFLDDARYNDETGQAPIPTGYSEVVFGELFRAAGWPRDETVVSNKLWWEFWPDQSPEQELAASLGRMGLDHVDLIYSESPPADIPLPDVVAMVTGLITAGMARAWGAFFWPPGQLERAWRIAEDSGVAGPVAIQPAYSLVNRAEVEDPAMQQVVGERNIAIVASYTLAGGILTGKYDTDPHAGRAAGMLGEPRNASSLQAGRELADLARELGRDPAQLAVAFALGNPLVSTVLFGATKPEQVRSNVAALTVAAELGDDERSRLAAIGRR